MVENEHQPLPEDEVPDQSEPKIESRQEEEDLPNYIKEEREMERIVAEVMPEADRLMREQLKAPIRIKPLTLEETDLPQKPKDEAPAKSTPERRGLNLRERGLLWQLKRRKVEHPKEALEAIRALEAHFKVGEFQHFTVSKDSYSDFSQRWEKKGYRVSAAYSQEKAPSGKVRVDVVRERPFRMDAWNMSWLVRMCKAVPNPADFLISLNKIGVIHGLYKHEIEDGKNFMPAFESKKTRELVGALAESGVEILSGYGSRISAEIGGEEKALGALHPLAEKLGKVTFSQKEKDVLRELMQLVPPTPQELETFLSLIDKPEAVSFLAELKKMDEGFTSRFDRGGLLRSAQLSGELGIAGVLARLFHEGIKLRRNFFNDCIVKYLRAEDKIDNMRAFESLLALKNFLRGKSIEELKATDIYNGIYSADDIERATRYSAALGRIPSWGEMTAFEGTEGERRRGEQAEKKPNFLAFLTLAREFPKLYFTGDNMSGAVDHPFWYRAMRSPEFKKIVDSIFALRDQTSAENKGKPLSFDSLMRAYYDLGERGELSADLTGFITELHTRFDYKFIPQDLRDLERLNTDTKQKEFLFSTEITQLLQLMKATPPFALDQRSQTRETPKLINDLYRGALNAGEKSPYLPHYIALAQRLGAKTDEFYKHHADRLADLFEKFGPEEMANYFDVIERIDHSPSQEIQRLKDQLIAQIIATDDPIESYKQIESVFVHNHLPTVGKVFKVFSILHPPQILEDKLRGTQWLSPYLRGAQNRERMYTIYRDLMRVHVLSGNLSLREYIATLAQGERILSRVDEAGEDALTEDEKKQLEVFARTVETLHENSQLEQDSGASENSSLKVRDVLQSLRASLEVAPGKSFSARLSAMFLRPIGIRSFEDVLGQMQGAKQAADERSRDLVRRARGGKLSLAAGDLLKGVEVQFIHQILQNGIVAKEYLGASSDSDATPLDTDVSRVLPKDAEKGFAGAVEASMAKGYGQLLFALRNRGQFQESNEQNRLPYDPRRYELFPSSSFQGTQPAVEGSRHYGIRTGLPTTEIDFMIAREGLIQDPKGLEKVYYEIAQNGFYIPVADETGKIIFTPELYQQYRKTFDGIKRFDGDRLEVSPTTPTAPHAGEVEDLSSQMRSDRARVEAFFAQISQVLTEVLGEEGINFKHRFEPGLLGAELLNIGSSGRGTNNPGDYDFDLTIKLDDEDIPKVRELAKKVMDRWQPREDKSHSEENRGYYQLRAIGAKIGEATLDIDIGFSKKSDLAQYGSHDAVEDKLNWIKENLGEKQYEDVLANIVLTKQILNAGGAYKRVDHGGVGGIGVENWILANKGNMVEAFQSFWDAAHSRGQARSFDEFKQGYKILNAGMNVKRLFHDNYIENMTEAGYEAMLRTIESYCTQHRIRLG